MNESKVKKCSKCGRSGVELKRGWTNALYCSYDCERAGVNAVHASMPGIGPSPTGNWIPHHTLQEINNRWNSR